MAKALHSEQGRPAGHVQTNVLPAARWRVSPSSPWHHALHLLFHHHAADDGGLPALRRAQKRRRVGRRKITQYTRYATVALAFVQALGHLDCTGNPARPGAGPGPAVPLTTVATLVTGTMFLMWLGEQITERGLGNGISMIIFGGIAAGLRCDRRLAGTGCATVR